MQHDAYTWSSLHHKAWSDDQPTNRAQSSTTTIWCVIGLVEKLLWSHKTFKPSPSEQFQQHLAACKELKR